MSMFDEVMRPEGSDGDIDMTPGAAGGAEEAGDSAMTGLAEAGEELRGLGEVLL